VRAEFFQQMGLKNGMFVASFHIARNFLEPLFHRFQIGQ
jgi:hypothetical protein